jgi:UDP-perosamine 4-acetyltransferase
VSTPVIIVGAGGHGRVVADALRAAGFEVLGFTDPAESLHGALIDGLAVLGGDGVLDPYRLSGLELANGIGSVRVPDQRRAVQEGLAKAGWRFATVIHPGATVSPSARLESGVQVMAGAVVQPGAVLGTGSIVNTGAIVEHDCVVGSFCHVASGATLSGSVHLGAECHVGAGAVVIQGVRIGPRAVIGAGAVVIRDHPGSATLLGVPARVRGPR